jgi:hypothetical protein
VVSRPTTETIKNTPDKKPARWFLVNFTTNQYVVVAVMVRKKREIE